MMVKGQQVRGKIQVISNVKLMDVIRHYSGMIVRSRLIAPRCSRKSLKFYIPVRYKMLKCTISSMWILCAMTRMHYAKICGKKSRMVKLRCQK